MGYANLAVVSQQKTISLKQILCWLRGAVLGEIRFVVICALCHKPDCDPLQTRVQAVINIQWGVYCDSRTFLLPISPTCLSLWCHRIAEHGFLWQYCPTTAMKLSPILNNNSCIEQVLVQISNLFCLIFFLVGNWNVSERFILHKSIGHCVKLIFTVNVWHTVLKWVWIFLQ